MAGSLCDHDPGAVIRDHILDLKELLLSCRIIGFLDDLVHLVDNSFVAFGLPSAAETNALAGQECQLDIRIVVVNAPVHDGESEITGTVCIAVAAAPVLLYDVDIDADLREVFLDLLGYVEHRDTFHVKVADREIDIKSVRITGFCHQFLCLVKITCGRCIQLSRTSHEAYLEDGLGRDGAASADILHAFIVDSQSDGLLHELVGYRSADLGVFVHHDEADGLGRSVLGGDVLGALELIHGIVVQVQRDIDIAGLQSHHLGVGIAFETDDVLVDIGLLAPVIVVLFKDHFLIRDIGGHDIHTGAGTGGIQIISRGISRGSILGIRAAVLLDDGGIHDRACAVGQLGKQGAVRRCLMDDEGVVVNDLDALDIVHQEGRIAL